MTSKRGKRRTLTLWQQREAALATKGLNSSERWPLLLLLNARDAVGSPDKLRACYECRHMSGERDAWRCDAYKVTGFKAPAWAHDFPMMLKRCPAFVPEIAAEAPVMRQGELPFE